MDKPQENLIKLEESHGKPILNGQVVNLGKHKFAPGNRFGNLGGRPTGAKNILPKIRDRVFNEVYKRDLSKVSTEKLLQFVAATLPKDMTLAVSRPPEINYISQVPRPELEHVVTQVFESQVLASKEEPIT